MKGKITMKYLIIALVGIVALLVVASVASNLVESAASNAIGDAFN
ncbi:MAG: hypothetical protein R6V35_03135 [Candidatus Nanohaloarchaea archaeon]